MPDSRLPPNDPVPNDPMPNDLAPFWMPFTANRQFKAKPRILARAEGMYYYTPEGRQILDGTAGLWCCNAGHGQRRVVEAIQQQAAELDFAPVFQMGHPLPFELAGRLAAMMPGDLDHVFFTNSGSESVDTALKIALAYHRVTGNASRTRLIGRERGYHGVGFGGISVGGIVNNRRFFGSLLTGVDHMRHTHQPELNAFSHGQPAHGADLADDLERLVGLHGAETIAAVIVEPVAGSTGVLIPPVGYLQRLRAICDKHGILLIFDEVISGFGRLGTAFAMDKFGVIPDLVCTAKGLTSGTVPMGAVMATKRIYDAFMTGPEGAIELFHGYTYSAHPLACAAAIATLEVYKELDLFNRAGSLEAYWADTAHALKGTPNVVDIRTLGLISGVELASRPGAAVGARAYEVFLHCFNAGLMVRYTGETIAMSPPLIIEKAEIDRAFTILADAICQVD